MFIHTIAEQKEELRKTIRDRIRGLDPDMVRLSDEAICKQLIENLAEYKEANTIFCFVGTHMEIDTSLIIRHALKAGKTVAVPLCISMGIMEARRITGLDELKPGSYGILEPEDSCELTDSKDIDFAIIPCISCDRNCERLGQGGGFYDRFLKGRSFAAAVLCRECLMLEKAPKEPWDLAVDLVVTENRIYRKKT